MYEDKERESNTYYKRKVLRKMEDQREKTKRTIKDENEYKYWINRPFDAGHI